MASAIISPILQIRKTKHTGHSVTVTEQLSLGLPTANTVRTLLLRHVKRAENRRLEVSLRFLCKKGLEALTVGSYYNDF